MLEMEMETEMFLFLDHGARVGPWRLVKAGGAGMLRGKSVTRGRGVCLKHHKVWLGFWFSLCIA